MTTPTNTLAAIAETFPERIRREMLHKDRKHMFEIRHSLDCDCGNVRHFSSAIIYFFGEEWVSMIMNAQKEGRVYERN